MLGAEIAESSEAWISSLCRRASFAAVAFLCWEIMITFDEEVEWIWSKPNKVTLLKSLYLFLRYFTVAAHIVNETITSVLGDTPLDRHVCMSWYTFQIITAQSVLSCVEIILTLRVYALYQKSNRVWRFLSAVIFAEFAVMIVRSPITMRNVEWDESCMMVMEPRALVYLGVGGAITHSLIWLLTMYKNVLMYHDDRTMSPLLHIVFRDGAMAFMLMASLSIGSSMHQGFRNTWAHPVYSWFMSASSTAGCRLVLNIRKAIPSIDTPTATVELTTVEWTESSVNEEARE